MREQVSRRAGREDADPVHPTGYGLRTGLPDGGDLHGKGQRVRPPDVRALCGRVQRLCGRVREAQAHGALQEVRGRMPYLCRRMHADGPGLARLMTIAPEKNGKEQNKAAASAASAAF